MNTIHPQNKNSKQFILFLINTMYCKYCIVDIWCKCQSLSKAWKQFQPGVTERQDSGSTCVDFSSLLPKFWDCVFFQEIFFGVPAMLRHSVRQEEFSSSQVRLGSCLHRADPQSVKRNNYRRIYVRQVLEYWKYKKQRMHVKEVTWLGMGKKDGGK